MLVKGATGHLINLRIVIKNPNPEDITMAWLTFKISYNNWHFVRYMDKFPV